ncbi:hypothetical protein BTJ39_03565 [Izhakiella australiensis]|uniref:peptidoglycan lytic exotransglycosylase n=1 Tax=Izhakiella australiensis TaxID=1926881 RepID=A0A1S8YRP4_9GAMM|nr:hypothetical protein BTJ39_03565 [Izhakiella australiensis]
MLGSGLLTTFAVSAATWCFTDANGITQMADKPRHRGFKKCAASLTLPSAIRNQLQYYQKAGSIEVPQKNSGQRAVLPASARQRRQRDRWDGIINNYANRYKVNPALIKAVISVESGFDPKAKSSVGAMGLMQIMPETAKWLITKLGEADGRYDLHDPEKNIQLGVYFIALLAERYNNDLELVLAAYNAGPGAVDRYNNRVPPYRETQQYVEKIISYYQKYKI